MTHRNREVAKEARAKQTVLIVGGHGGLSDRYREVAAEHGWDLVHYEKKVPPGARHSIAHVALVVVMVGLVSHTLRDQVRSLAAADAPVVYLRTASVSALRSAVAQRAA
jgi:pyridoxine 5'-phosphate synthase PdxJ